VGASITRYKPSRQYFWAGLVAVVLAGFSAWCGLTWAPVYIAAFLFVVSAAIMLILALRPVIEITDERITIGKKSIPWGDIRRVDRTGWVSPLVLYMTLVNSRRVLLVYPGGMDASNSLCRHIRRNATAALLDGKPYTEVWGDPPPPPPRKPLPTPRYRLLTEEDEAEVERLYQRLKTVGNLDSKNSSDES
jgi:hypothetical protein